MSKNLVSEYKWVSHLHSIHYLNFPQNLRTLNMMYIKDIVMVGIIEFHNGNQRLVKQFNQIKTILCLCTGKSIKNESLNSIKLV